MRTTLFIFFLCFLGACSRPSADEMATLRIKALVQIDPETFRNIQMGGRYYDGQYYTGNLLATFKDSAYCIPNHLNCDSSMRDSVTRSLVLGFAAANGVGEDSACIFVRDRFAKAFAAYPKLKVESLWNFRDGSNNIVFAYFDHQYILYCPDKFSSKDEYWSNWLLHAKSFDGKWFYGER
jgi:hypothetical protein